MDILEVYNIIKSTIGFNSKITPSGWLSLNAPCCTHVDPSHRQDKLKRGGFRLTNDSLVYHCFNCGFTTSCKNDRFLSRKFKDLMKWINLDEDVIKKIDYEFWKNNKDNQNQKNSIGKNIIKQTMRFDDVNLPPNSINLLEAMNINPNIDTMCKVAYIESRGDFFVKNLEKFYCTDDKKDTMNRRVIIPFYWEESIVGYVGRTIDDNKYKYFGVIPPNYIFNTEVINQEHKFLIVAEGPFDALAINGVALLGDKASKLQIEWLKSTNKEIIVVPDFDGKKSKIKEIALQNNWLVADPEWQDGVKDCADAVKEFGRLYTMYSIFRSVGRINEANRL